MRSSVCVNNFRGNLLNLNSTLCLSKIFTNVLLSPLSACLRLRYVSEMDGYVQRITTHINEVGNWVKIIL